MGKTLYRSYRSTSFDEVLGQDHITKTLKNSLKKSSFGHAYLLSGPRGVGKTSIARIFAYEVNGQKYTNDSNSHLDVIEIDAASNRRIDEIRGIREKVNIAPVAGKYKVYIIDEVHMLTKEAFNALLKTLEEPPSHVIFILATTEAHKLPETIVSRCIQFVFKPISKEVIKDHLSNIAKSEKISIDDQALDLLSQHGNGSFRDSISLLEQVKNTSDKITSSDIVTMLGIAPNSLINDIISSLESNDVNDLKQQLDNAYLQGINVNNLTSQIQESLRHIILGERQSDLDKAKILNLQSKLLDVPGSSKPKVALEICLFEFIFENDVSKPTKTDPKPQLTQSPEVVKQKKQSNKDEEVKPQKHEIRNETHKEQEATDKNKASQTTESTGDIWSDCLVKLKSKNNTLYGIARMAESKIDQNTITLTFKFSFHRRQVDNDKNRKLFVDILKEVTGQVYELKTQTAEEVKNVDTPKSKDSLTDISNIFGSHEVLES